MKQTIRVLAIDGGGIRGIIPARVLVEVEKLTQRPVSKLFDLIIGTSTGGILALGLTRPRNNAPAFSAAQLLDLYLKDGENIFPHGGKPLIRYSGLFGDRVPPKQDASFGEKFKNFMGFAEIQKLASPFGGNPKFGGNAQYFPDGLEGLLLDYFGETPLSDALTQTIVTTYDMKAGVPILFSSSEAKNDQTRNPLMRHVARATSAGPTYFPPNIFHWGGEERIMIDGGVFANNPAMIGYIRGFELAEHDGGEPDVLLVSLGTGTPERQSKEQIARETVMSQNWLSVARGILNIVFTSTSDNQDDLLKSVSQSSKGKFRYWRFQPVLRNASPDLDNVTPDNLAALTRLANEHVAAQTTAFIAIGEQLLS
ncbi:MAG: patatin-like phospholipase family protein [Acidobacteriota bacterium]|nr:patatin-like phospholipase family protein [Acidobacteriota bacterium]